MRVCFQIKPGNLEAVSPDALKKKAILYVKNARKDSEKLES